MSTLVICVEEMAVPYLGERKVNALWTIDFHDSDPNRPTACRTGAVKRNPSTTLASRTIDRAFRPFFCCSVRLDPNHEW